MKTKANKNNGQFAVHEPQRLEKQNQQALEKQNIRTVMQTLHGCRQNCRECRQEEAEWEPKIEQKEVKRA